jgi:DNA gyrase subunit A
VGMLDVTEKNDLMITCKSGVTIRLAVNAISEQGRATQGVKLIRLDEGDEIAAITRIDVEEETEELTAQESEPVTDTDAGTDNPGTDSLPEAGEEPATE